MLTAGIETSEKKSFGLNRGHQRYQRRKGIQDRMTRAEQRDMTRHPVVVRSSRKEKIAFLPAFFRNDCGIFDLELNK